MDKHLFLSRLQHERDRFELLLNQTGFARQMTIKGVSGGLSIKDLLADVLARELFIADRLSELLLGEEYLPCNSQAALLAFEKKFGYPDYESTLVDPNQPSHLFIYKHKNIALDDIVTQELVAYRSIIAAVEKLSHAQCADHDVFQRVAEQTFIPYRQMIEKIQRWRESISS